MPHSGTGDRRVSPGRALLTPLLATVVVHCIALSLITYSRFREVITQFSEHDLPHPCRCGLSHEVNMST